VARQISLIDGASVRAELDRLGLTQKAFAILVGTREATVANVLNGRPCSPEMLMRFAIALKHAKAARR
jgi:plasmid maintenance system antidote protein VapI